MTQSFPSPRAGVLVGMVAVLLLLIGTIGWGVLARIDGAVVVPGQIEVERDRQIVQHPEGGKVAEIWARESEFVEKGASLLRLDTTRDEARVRHIDKRLLELAGRQARLIAEREGAAGIDFPRSLSGHGAAEIRESHQAWFALRRTATKQQIAQIVRRRAQIERQLDGFRAQLAALQRQKLLLEQDLAKKAQLLDRGLAPSGSVLDLRREAAGIDGQIGALEAARAEASERMVELDIEAARLANTPREEAVAGLQEIRLRLLDLQEERATLAAKIALASVRAPVAGVVNGLEIPGREAVIAPAQPILYIVPQDRPLLVAARLPPRHVGQVFAGQHVRVRLTSLAHADAPDLKGRVTRISAAAFEDRGQGGPYYRVDIALDPAARQMLDRRGALRPGMAVDAFVKTGQRSPLAYFTAPITSYFAHAFRES